MCSLRRHFNGNTKKMKQETNFSLFFTRLSFIRYLTLSLPLLIRSSLIISASHTLSSSFVLSAQKRLLCNLYTTTTRLSFPQFSPTILRIIDDLW